MFTKRESFLPGDEMEEKNPHCMCCCVFCVRKKQRKQKKGENVRNTKKLGHCEIKLFFVLPFLLLIEISKSFFSQLRCSSIIQFNFSLF